MPKFIDPRSILKCYDRLEKSREALFNCKNSNTASQFQSYWAAFLINTGSVLNAIDAGANFSPQGKQWYGGIKRAGRADELVSYMHQARNVEEHGRDDVTETVPRSPFGLRDPDTGAIEWMTNETDMFANPRRTLIIGFNSAGPTLLPVSDDRFGKTFQPPSMHKGKSLHNPDPLSVADMYLSYIVDLVHKAEALS